MSYEKLIFPYGLNGIDHRLSIMYLAGAGNSNPIGSPGTLRPGYNPLSDTPANDSELMQTIRLRIQQSIDGNLTQFDTLRQVWQTPDSLISEDIYSLPALSGSNNVAAGITGQFVQWRGKTEVSTTSRHRLYGISGAYNGARDNLTVGAGNALGELIILYNSFDCIAITNQLGASRGSVRVGPYSGLIRHNTDHHATKRFSY